MKIINNNRAIQPSRRDLRGCGVALPADESGGLFSAVPSGQKRNHHALKEEVMTN